MLLKCFILILFYKTFVEVKVEGFSDKNINNTEDALNIAINSSKIIYEKINYYKEMSVNSKSVTKIILNHIAPYNKILNNFGYLLIQVQSFAYNLTFSRNFTLEKNYHQNGTSLGFVIFDMIKNDNTFYIHNLNSHINVSYALIIIMYDNESPIPGGCNLDGDTKESPRIILNTVNDMILVDTPSASNSIAMDPIQYHCDTTADLIYEPKYYYLPKNDFTKKKFFESVKKLLIVDSVIKNGKKALRESFGPSNRRTYIAVPGTGIIFNTIVSINGSIKKSAYIPTYTYSCNPFFWESGCTIIPDSALMNVIANILLVIGLVKVFSFGELYTSVFLNSIVIGAHISYRIIIYWDVTDTTKSILLISSAIVFALIVLTISLAVPLLEWIFYIVTGGIFSWIVTINVIYLFDSTNETLYVLILCFTFFTILCFFSTTFKITWAFINIAFGAYTALVGIQLMTRSNMIFIPLNYISNIRSNNYAYINGLPEPDQNDIYIFIGMALLAFIAFLFQRKNIIKNTEQHFNESEPLITRWTDGSDDVFESPNTNHKFFRRHQVPWNST